jgi:arylsulfatase
VNPEYQAPFPFTGGTIDRVIVDVSGDGYANHEEQVRAWFGID